MSGLLLPLLSLRPERGSPPPEIPYALVVTYWGRMAIIDVSNPHEVGYICHPQYEYTFQVAAKGKHAFLVATHYPFPEGTFVVLDISNPQSPTELSRIANTLLDDCEGGTFVSGDFVYLCGDYLVIMDVSDLLNPVMASYFRLKGNTEDCRDIHVVGQYAFAVSNGGNCLSCLDVSNPASPSEVSYITGFSRPAGVVVDEVKKLAYVAEDKYVDVVDISDPTDMKVLGYTDASDNLTYAEGIDIAGDFVYVAGEQRDRLVVVDCSDPENPVEVKAIQMDDLSWSCQQVLVHGNRLYVADYWDFRVFDISDRANPVQLSTLEAKLDCLRFLEASGNHVFCFAGRGVTSIDVSNPASPSILDCYWDAVSVAGAGEGRIQGNYFYTVYTGGLYVFDISDPANITLAGQVQHANLTGAGGLDVSGDYAYVVIYGDPGRMTIVDISDPTSPVVRGSYTHATYLSWAQRVKLSGNHVYVVQRGPGGYLTVINVTDKDNPTLTTALQDTKFSWSYCIDISGGYAYITSLYAAVNAMTVVDISNPAAPVIRGSVSLVQPWEVQVSGDYAHVAVQEEYYEKKGKLSVVDVSNPDSPTEVAFLRSANTVHPETLFKLGNIIYLGCNWGLIGTVTTIDVSNPLAPVELGSVTSNHNGYPGGLVLTKG